MSSESRAQSIPLHSSESHRSKRRRNSFVSKSDAIRHERRQKAMQKFKSKKTNTTRKMQKSVDNGESSDDDTIYATLPKEQPRPPWSSSTKVVKKGQMMSDPSENLGQEHKNRVRVHAPQLASSKAEQPSSYKKYSIANKSPPRSSGSKFMSKARFIGDLSDSLMCLGPLA